MLADDKMNYTYLDEYALKLELRNNRSVQHWQSWYEDDGFRIIKWIEVDSTRNGKYAIFEIESLDCGSEDFIDMIEFETAGDPDEPEGKRSEFESIESVIDYLQTIGADLNKFVKFCEIQYIYLEFFLKNGSPKRDSDEWFISG